MNADYARPHARSSPLQRQYLPFIPSTSVRCASPRTITSGCAYRYVIELSTRVQSTDKADSCRGWHVDCGRLCKGSGIVYRSRPATVTWGFVRGSVPRRYPARACELASDHNQPCTGLMLPYIPPRTYRHELSPIVALLMFFTHYRRSSGLA
jgi:hypothetical protein